MVPAAFISRLQAYLRYSAWQQCQTVPVPPFTIFLRLSGEASEDDHAVPDEPLEDDIRQPLARLREAFETRARRTRIRFLAEFAPVLRPPSEPRTWSRRERSSCLLAHPTP